MIASLKLLYGKTGPASRRTYFARLTIFWFYALIWLVSMFVINVKWTASPVWKLLLDFCGVVLAPSASDLFRSYEGYLEEFSRRMPNSARSPQS
jgi:hypothetical protein